MSGSSTFAFSGAVDEISRANGDRHYIGTKLENLRLVFANPTFIDGMRSGMVDGQSVALNPKDINEAGIVVGSAGADMVVSSSPLPQITISGASPLAINDHTYPAPSPAVQPSPAPSPQPTPIPAPQILSWVGNGLAIWERQPDGQTWHPFGLEEMIPSMDGWDYIEPYDMNDTGAIVGRGWYTDPSTPNAQGEYHAFLLVPAELMVDGDRDLKLTQADKGTAIEDNPFRFWINDDDDGLDTFGHDIPGNAVRPNFATQPRPDGSDTGTINGTRDLIDFFPVYSDIKQLLQLLPVTGPAAFTVKLKHEDGSLNFVYTDLTRQTAYDYLHRLSGDRIGNATILGGAEPSHGAATIHITKTGVPLEASWLARIIAGEKGVILAEGRSATKHPLILEVADPHGREVAEVRLPISLSPVEQMYRHKNLMAASNAVGGMADYATGNDGQHSEPVNCPDSPFSTRTLVFVHGYNVPPDKARGWNSEMFKRLYHAGSRAKFVGVTWNGAQGDGTLVPPYQKNVDNAFLTAKPLAEFLNQVVGHVIVVGHSLGNVVLGSAIEDWAASVEKYFMIDAAVPEEAYDEDATKDASMIHPDWNGYQDRLRASEWHANPTFAAADKRRTLTWRNRFSHFQEKKFNFYSSSEDVLRKHPGDPGIGSVVEAALSGGRFAWVLQEKLKGRQISLGIGKCGSTYGGWKFSSNLGPAAVSSEQAAQLSDLSLKDHPIFDPGFTIRLSPPPPNDGPPPKEISPGTPLWITDLTDSSQGSVVAEEHRSQLLAEMFPSRTLPAGANNLLLLEDRNFDMPALYKNGWPPERGAVTDWLHSDVKTVAYPYIFGLFEKWVTLGNLTK